MLSNLAWLGTGSCEDINTIRYAAAQWLCLAAFLAGAYLLFSKKGKIAKLHWAIRVLLAAVLIVVSIVGFIISLATGGCTDNGSGIWLFGVTF